MYQMDLFDFVATIEKAKKIQGVQVEIPTPKGDYEFSLQEVIVPNGMVGKIRANINAVKFLKNNIFWDKTSYNSLAMFTAWGAVSKVFDEKDATLLPYRNELKEILTTEEYQAAMASTLTSFYTPFNIINHMWSLVRKSGFTGGKVAEFGAGIGHFIGLCPIKSNIKFTAVESDVIAGKILQKLYPETDCRICGLETLEFKNEFDLIIGNVPFGKIGVYDKKYPRLNLHNYFIARSIDALKAGGLAVLLTSSSTLDSKDGSARELFASGAALIGAIRLPDNTFPGTEIVSDILVFQKNGNDCNCSGKQFIELKNVETRDETGMAEINEYFADHQDMLLGSLSNTGHMYGKSGQLTLKSQNSFTMDFANSLEAFPSDLYSPTTVMMQETEEEIDVQSFKEYAIFLLNGIPYQRIEGKALKLADKNGNPVSYKETAKIKSYLDLKKALTCLISNQLDPMCSEEELTEFRTQLNQSYDKHIGIYGNISNKLIHKRVATDPAYHLVCSLENIKTVTETNPNGIKINKKIYVKGDILKQRTQYPWTEPETAENVVAAGLISYAYRHKIDLVYVQRLMKYESTVKAKEELLKSGEFFETEENILLLKSEYLSGNVVRKLELAKLKAGNNPAYAENVKALLAVQPNPIGIEDIEFVLGTYWIPSEIVKSWLNHEFRVHADINYNVTSDKWYVNVPVYEKFKISEMKVNDLDVFDIVEISLNLKDPVIHKKVHVDGKEKEVIDNEATLVARQIKIDLLNRFERFIRGNASISRELEIIYNKLFNSHVDRSYELPKFDIYPNASKYINGKSFILKPHQKKAVTRCIEGNTLLAHCVGAGKTAVMITAAMEFKRMKLATKNMIVVQNATLDQFAAFAPKLYPNAKILVATKDDLVKEKRKSFLSRIATYEWDIVIIAQSSFDMLENDPVIVKEYYQDQIDALDRIMLEMENNYSRKDIERSKKSLQNRMDKLNDFQKEDILYFHELGIDALFVDEAHAYKRNFFPTKMEAVKGLDRGASQRAFNLSIKIDQIMQKTGGRNIIFATGTPVTNTITELWTMLKYIAPETLADFGCDTFDRFASTFTATEIALELDAAGRFKMVKRFCKYMNTIELARMFRMNADIILTEDLKDVERPALKGGAIQKVIIPRSSNMEAFMRYLVDTYEWYENLSSKKEYSYVPLQIFGMSRKATIDLRLIHHALADDANSKLSISANMIYDRYLRYNEMRGTQLVFCDLYQLEVANGVLFNAWSELKHKLVTKGIPENEIAIISDCTDRQRAILFEQVNKGEVRVIIGSTTRLGTGVNIQERLAVLYHIDAPFRPSDMEQRNGRILRQGNIFTEVEIIEFGIDQTLDASMYQILERKQIFINDALKGRHRRSAQEIELDTAMDYATFSAAISGNSLLREKVARESRIKELEALQVQFFRSQRQNKTIKEELAGNIVHYESKWEELQNEIISLKGIKFDHLAISIDNKQLAGSQDEIKRAFSSRLLYGASAHSNEGTFLKANINGCTLEFHATKSKFGNKDLEISYHLNSDVMTDDFFALKSDIKSLQGLLNSLASLISYKDSEVSNLKISLEAYKAKIESLNIELQKNCPYSAELNEQKKGLEKIIYEIHQSSKNDQEKDQWKSKERPELEAYLVFGDENLDPVDINGFAFRSGLEETDHQEEISA